MAKTVECAMCDTAYDPEANAGSCPDCGTPDPEYTSGVNDDDEGVDDTDELECPNCGHQVNADESFCTNCSEELDSDDGPEKPAVPCPDCGETIPEGGDFCTNCGTKRNEIGGDKNDQAESDDAEDDEAKAPSVTLVIGSSRHSIVEDGDIVVEDDSFGLDARYDAVDLGKKESEATTISREHLLFEIRDGDVVMIENGRNDTTLNGEDLNDGDERVLSDSDEIGLNGVVTAEVELE